MARKQPLQTLTHADLLTALQSAPALELKGVLLLREQRATGRLPEDRQRLVEATTELVTYTAACKHTAEVLRTLQPIPAREDALVEGYSL